MPKALRYLAHSEIGLVRRNNQDSGYASPTMLMVADGMGGAAAGDLASAVAIRELKAADEAFTGTDAEEVLAGAIARANDQLADLVRADPALDGMGTTVCGLLFDGQDAALANIGDSRAYQVRDGVMRRITRDHSWVQTLVDDGRITEAEALVHPHRSLILRVLNGNAANSPDLDLLDVEVGDRLLICSDGLCGLVTDADIESVVTTDDRQQVMKDLIAMAHQAGGLDNITIILADVVDGEPEGTAQVLGAAAELDLSAVAEDTAILRTEDLRPRPDPAAADRAERLRYAPTSRQRPLTWAKVVLGVLLPLVLIGAGGFGWYSFVQTKLFVGASNDVVAIFRGVPDKPFGIALSSVVEAQHTRVNDLPPFYRERVLANIPVADWTAAKETTAELEEFAERCIAQREARATMTAAPSVTPSATPTATSTSAPSGSPSPSVGPTPGGTSTAAASPSSTPTTLPTSEAPGEC